jgi:hypothetical protein
LHGSSQSFFLPLHFLPDALTFSPANRTPPNWIVKQNQNLLLNKKNEKSTKKSISLLTGSLAVDFGAGIVLDGGGNAVCRHFYFLARAGSQHKNVGAYIFPIEI